MNGPLAHIFCLVGWGALLTASINAQAESWSLGISSVVLESHWVEHGVSGNQLLQEKGVLNGLALDASGSQDRWAWHIHRQASTGQRYYVGRDSFGSPAETHVRVSLDQRTLGIDYLLVSGIRVGLDGIHRAQRRELMSLPGGPTGYTERWATDALALRLGWVGRGCGIWYVNGSWGLWTRSTLMLTQANRDDATLIPKNQKVAHIGVRWDAWEGAGLRVGLSGQLDWRHSDRSDPVAISQFGALRGTATQPETAEQLLRFGLHLAYAW